MHRTFKLSLVGALAAGAIVAPNAQAAETLKLDTRQAPAAGVAGRAITTDDLKDERTYIAEVSGRFSFYPQATWTAPVYPIVLCGTPKSITEPSPGQPAGLGGNDVETVFAAPANFGCGNFKPPIHWASFEIATKGTYDHVEPLGGPFSSPRGDSTYTYVLEGNDEPARFRLMDSNASDNNGVVTIDVRRAKSDDCKKGGWVELGFRNQGQCVSSSARN